MPARRKVVFEKVSEDANGAIYHVEAIHATTTRNNRKYTEEELKYAARSLSGRPINYNHDEGRWLPYDYTNKFGPNSNSTVYMEYDPTKKGIVGDVWITDALARANIEAGNIRTVSIEQTPTKGESCACMIDSCTCEQHGIVFDAIAILETYKGVQPGDPNAKIGKESAEPSKVEAFKCEECGKSFDTKEALQAHYSDAHKQEIECPCGLEKALGKELYEELKKAELWLQSVSSA